MNVRAKVQCISRKEVMGSAPAEEDGRTVWKPATVYTYEFSFVSGDKSDENKRFWYASPDGALRIGAIREDLYQVGQHYYIDFTPAPAL